jgi:general stress protein YciG
MVMNQNNQDKNRENLRGGSGNFKNDPERASEAGRKGGQQSQGNPDNLRQNQNRDKDRQQGDMERDGDRQQSGENRDRERQQGGQTGGGEHGQHGGGQQGGKSRE